MIKLIKNANVYAPEKLGRQDILIAGEKIAAIAPEIKGYDGLAGVEVYDLGGATVAPGIIDIHVHITGGGGELGPISRVPELYLSQLTACGITTVLGLLGTDGITRSQEALVSKARALTQEGITAYCLAGAYQCPSPTMLGQVAHDIALIDPVIGVKTAISDHRGSTPSIEELIRLGSDARLGGILSGKAGIVVAHIGIGSAKLDLIFEALRRSEIPPKTFVPTHCDRNEALAAQAAEFTRMGGTADFTADPDGTKGGTAHFVTYALGQGAVAENITISSDSGGSLPRFDASGACIGMGVGTPKAMLPELERLVNRYGLPLEQALMFFTSNPAKAIAKAGVKGCLSVGADADIMVLSPQLSLQSLFARGRLMVEDGRPVVLGMFERK